MVRGTAELKEILELIAKYNIKKFSGSGYTIEVGESQILQPTIGEIVNKGPLPVVPQNAYEDPRLWGGDPPKFTKPDKD